MTRRDKYYYQLRTLRLPGSVSATPSHEMHKRRRDSLMPFFGKRNVLYHEPLITQKVDQLWQLIAKHAAERTPLNLYDVFFAFSNEYVSNIKGRIMLIGYSVVTNFLFSRQTDVLADETKAATLRHNSNELLMGISINKHFPWFPDFLESLPLFISKPIMPPGLIDLLALYDVSDFRAWQCIFLTR
jgi:hypothetical protein